MMSAFFHLQHTLNRLFNDCIKLLILDKFFLKYEGGSNRSPALLRLKEVDSNEINSFLLSGFKKKRSFEYRF